LTTPEKVAAVTSRLEQLGAVSPRIRGEIQPYTLSHSVAGGSFVMKDCQFCHSRQSGINREIQLSAYVPDGVIPELVKDVRTQMVGNMQIQATGELVFQPALDPRELYIHGSLRPQWLDIIGMVMVTGSILGILLHGGLRFITALKRK